MVTLGAYTGEDGCAAAVAVDGHVVSALSDTSANHARESSGLPTGLVEQVLRHSGLEAGDINRIVVAEDQPAVEQLDQTVAPGTPVVRIGRLHAEAAQLRGEPGDGIVLGVDNGPEGHAALFSKQGGTLRCLHAIPGTSAMFQLARSVAAALGGNPDKPWSTLESCYGSTDESLEAQIRGALRTEGASIHVDAPAMKRLLAEARVHAPAPLDAHDSAHIGVRKIRVALATATLNRIGDVLADVAGSAHIEGGSAFVGFSGSMFGSPAVTERLAAHLRTAAFAPVPERVGAALGAALLPHDVPAPVRHLSLGPGYSDHAIKADLENCRLDYVYEPDWTKLLTRASDLLRSGATIAWFQGNREFGPRSFGSRSVLCDPSSQWARENVNVFLLHREASTPLPVSIAAAAASTLGDRHRTRFDYANGSWLNEHRGQLTSVVDRHGRGLIHVTDQSATPELYRLLDLHYARTGVPGLINVALESAAGGLAMTPRDAVRETFGSAVDALVIGRFLVSKDYWLLRKFGRGND